MNNINMMRLYTENLLSVAEMLRDESGLSEVQKHNLDIACAFVALAQLHIEKIFRSQSHSDRSA
jgi:hypothetical protein